ncbi:MAG: hypothetical protein M1819_002231 [Sarea resinae]|nr:MAG: hypothetical protein M1819_002231 [Sarea resinae]
MGIVSSRPDDGAALYLSDQNRLSLSSLTITNSRRHVLLTIAPNSFPATRITAKREVGDDSMVEFVQDPESLSPQSPPSFLLRLNNEDELIFNFTFILRQTPHGQHSSPSPSGVAEPAGDSVVNNLTYIFASSSREIDNLVTREFHADPNLHKNSNVQLLEEKYSTNGNPSVQFDWSWTWRPPKPTEDRGGGWRNSCSFVEYDQRAHRLDTVASFSFWVQNMQRLLPHSPRPSNGFDTLAAPRLRVPSTQSTGSRLSDTDLQGEFREPSSPNDVSSESGLGLTHALTNTTIKVDVGCQRPGGDMSAVDDGPLFRATMKALEQKTGSMRARMKKVLKKAEAVQSSQVECNAAMAGFMEALREASASNAHAVRPALDHYFEKIAKEILQYEKANTINLQKLIIEPLSKLYYIDIKQAEAKKKDFEDESRDYYSYLSRYLGQRQDSLKEKKRAESDSKYQSKRRNFELKRFDYSSFMQDLHGGRKEQEVLSHLTKFADAQARSFLATSKKVEEMVPQLEALSHEVKEADKEYQFQRTEREEKRRTLEKSTTTYVEPESTTAPTVPSVNIPNANGSYISDAEFARLEVIGSAVKSAPNSTSATTPSSHPSLGTSVPTDPFTSPSSQPSVGVVQNKFRGIRDLEEKDYSSVSSSEQSGGQQRKEGLLWALSRPGSHADPKGLNKQAWHKFWIVLDQGKLSEYSNWKQRLDLHMEPIDLRMASVREARNTERRFCLEVITPQFKRVYQATSEEDMTNWINAINNALQSAVELSSINPAPPTSTTQLGDGKRRDIGSVLTGKSSSSAGYSHATSVASSAANNMYRRITVGARPNYVRTSSNSFEDNPSKLLQIVRDADQGNCWCADCGSGIKTEWVSINLAIVLCIECSGIHRSLGTHISKVRSLTLDTTSFTTDIVELLLLVGNRVSNMVWEAKLDKSQKPTPQATREQRLKFIVAKYADRAFVTPISPTLSHYSTADETLLASIKKNDLHGVLYALALKANPNATDRSRNTHAIFLALAAADPAPPGAPSATSSPNRPETPGKVVAFPIAELLIQNGAEIPSQLPAFPLSNSARLYVDQKSGRSGSSAISGDTLTALPVFMAGDGSSPAQRQKERESKLQKRVSAGGRLARSGG